MSLLELAIIATLILLVFLSHYVGYRRGWLDGVMAVRESLTELYPGSPGSYTTAPAGEKIKAGGAAVVMRDGKVYNAREDDR